MSLLVTATLASALAALAGGILVIRGADKQGAAQPAASDQPASGESHSPGPLGRLKIVIRAGDWSTAFPSLLALGGILGVMLFGALALIFTFDQSRSGWPMLILAILTLGWAVREYVRA